MSGACFVHRIVRNRTRRGRRRHSHFRITALAAGRDLSIGVAEETYGETHDRQVKQSGLFSSGGASITIGRSQVDQGSRITQVTPRGSLVGSSDGAVTLHAGNALRITGSAVLSQAGTAIVGQDVTIEAALGTTDTGESYAQQQAGLNIGLTGGVVDAGLAVYGAARRSDAVDDDRLKALHAAKAAYAVNDGINAAQKSATDGKHAAGASLRIGLGASSASSTTDTHGDTAYGSQVQSQGDVSIAATGGDLDVIGSQITGQDVGLSAANALTLRSQAEQHTLDSRNRNGGAELGVSVGTTTGVYLSAYAGRGTAEGNGTPHAESIVTANDTLTLASGGNTTLQGAQAIGARVLGRIGGDLRIESEQDTDDYASQQQQAGVTLVYGWSGSAANYSQQATDSHFASVAEQSGLQAGSGGFDIEVGGNTTLIGGAIASSADASRNFFSTQSLATRDIENGADYSASRVGISGGIGQSVMPGIGIPQSADASSRTRSGISAGTLVVRDGDTSALENLDRGVTQLQQQGLETLFDEKKVAERMEMGQLAGEVGFRAAGDVAQALTREYTHAQVQAAGAQEVLDSPSTSPEERAIAQRILEQANTTMAANQGQYDLWRDGGSAKTLLHAATGALVASVGGGNALQGALGAGAAELGRPLTADKSRLVQQMVSAGIGAAAGGGSGASTGLAGEVNNRQLHPEELAFIKDKAADYAAEQGLSVEEAEQALLRGALMRNDEDWNELLTLYVPEQVSQYDDAFGWLAGQAGASNLLIHDSGGVIQPAFTSSAQERANEALYAREVLENPDSLRMYLDSGRIDMGEASVGELTRAYLKNPGAEREAFLEGAGNAVQGFAALVDPATYRGIATFAQQMANDPGGTTGRVVKGLKDLGIEAGAEVMVDVMQLDLQDLRDGTARLRGGIAVEVVVELATLGTVSAVTAAKYGLRGTHAVATAADAAEGVAQVADGIVARAVRGADGGASSAARSAGARYDEIVSSINGRVIGEFGAVDNGPLSASAKSFSEAQQSIAATFSGGRYAEIELTDDLIAYRAWSPDQAREYGAFWSLEKPSGSLQTRIDSALLPEWGQLRSNPVLRQQTTQYTEVVIPKGTRIYLGEVGSQGGAWVGGGSQLLIKDGSVLPDWKIGGGPLN